MANTKSAAKRARQTKHRTLNNSRTGTQVKSAKRKLRDLIKAGDKAFESLEPKLHRIHQEIAA